MKIAHVTDCYLPRLGGIELQVHDLAVRQAATHDVTIITSTVGEGRAEAGAGADPGAGPGMAARGRVSGRRGLAEGGGRLRQGRGAGRAVLALPDSDQPQPRVVRVSSAAGRPDAIRYRSAHQGRPEIVAGEFDIVHVHASSFSPLAFLAAQQACRQGIPTVATVHSLWAKATPLFRAADLITRWGELPIVFSAVSNAAAAPLRQIIGGRAEVTVLPNGVDPGRWKVAYRQPDPGLVRLVAVSRLASRKRLLQLFRILHDARRELPPDVRLRVEVLGDGPQRDRLERFLLRHDMQDWVLLRGRCSREEIRTVLGRSDAFVAPAKLESFGIAALEARCAGLPVIALAGTGVQDFVEHGRDGWLVDSDEAMKETIVSLARSPELLARVAAHNRVTPPSIGWSEVLGGCESLYRRATLLQGREWPRRMRVEMTQYDEVEQVVSEL